MGNTTIILRHCKENLKKCSLRGLEQDARFEFYTYPKAQPKLCKQTILLSPHAPTALSKADGIHPLFLVDGTWRYAEKMIRNTPMPVSTQLRSLPVGWKTAYPRRQDDLKDNRCGLASIEALYVAFLITGRSTKGLLDQYYWKDTFLGFNKQLIKELRLLE